MNRTKNFAILIGALLAALPVRGQDNVDATVAQNLRPILPGNGKPGGVAVAVRMDGKTRFFNYGMADNAQEPPGHSRLDFQSRLRRQGVCDHDCLRKRSSRASSASTIRLAKYVTELQRGGDIRRITLGQLASHTSGLPRVPQQYETWHRGRYTWPDFVRFLNSWKAGPNHEPGKQYLYSNAAMVLLRVALERRFNTRFAALMHARLTGPLGMTSTALPLPRDLLVALCKGMARRVGRLVSRVWKGEHLSGLAPVKSIRHRATWPPFWPRIRRTSRP